MEAEVWFGGYDMFLSTKRAKWRVFTATKVGGCVESDNYLNEKCIQMTNDYKNRKSRWFCKQKETGLPLLLSNKNTFQAVKETGI